MQFVGICADATKLGVCREHLYRVLTGERTSKSLLKRYQELKAKGGQLSATQPATTTVPTIAPAVINPCPQTDAHPKDGASRGLQKSNLNSKRKP